MSLEETVADRTSRLARFVADTRYTDLPGDVLERARLITLDTVGVSLRGSLEPEMQALYRRLPAGSGARLLRSGFPAADPAVAAFANATATCFLELDEGSRPTGHPALHVLPSALALSQALHAPGSEFLTALVIGYEVQARIQRAARLRWPVHPHGNFGHPAAVVALGKLSGWSAEQLRQGINGATALAMATSWQPCIVGATIRNAYPGLTAQTAFQVKLLVESGFTGYDSAVGETFGEILGEGFDPDQLTANLGERFALLDNYFKFHAACALTHPVLDALAAALGATPNPGGYPPWSTPELPGPDEVTAVKVRVMERFARLSAPARPNQLSAKFSVPYAVAAYLVRGSSDPAGFSGDSLTDPRIMQLQKKVEVRVDPEMSARWPAEAPAAVMIQLSNGEILEGTCSNPFGSMDQPATAADLEAKFRFLTANVLTTNQQDAVWRRGLDLNSIEDMSTFPSSKQEE